MSEQNIKNWSVLNSLNKDFTKNIKQIYVFGVNGKQVIAITNDDNVYSFGDNDSNGSLGLGHTNPIQQPTKIEELCAKQVIHFEFGVQYDFVIALTQNAVTQMFNVFSWGTNRYGELGIGNTISQYKPTIINALSDMNVIDIKSGINHSLALTECGDVYIWGHLISTIPEVMLFNDTNQKIIAISSGCNHALALTNTGNVYAWGNNVYGQCGNEDNFTYFRERKQWNQSDNTSDLCVKKIVCGSNHNLLLSSEGMIYCFGDNQFGQCGDGTNVNKNMPTKVNTNAKFVDISATKHMNISVGLTDTGSCYIWGKCGQNMFSTPFQIPSKNMNDVLQLYSINKATINPLHFTDKDCKPSLMDRISDKFDKRKFSDITFKVEDKYIYAQKSHLINVCKHFERMFSNKKWKECNTRLFEVKNYSYNVYYAFIKYLYTDFVDINADEDMMELLDIGRYYLDDCLKQRCFDLIMDKTTNENVFAIYYSAVKYNSIEIKSFCLKYIKNNLKADETNIESIMDNAVKFTDKVSQNF